MKKPLVALLSLLFFAQIPVPVQAAAAPASGYIYLQVQDKGQAWYLSPVDGKRYFLGRPSDAFEVMKKMGLGISNADFSRIPSRLRGRILLQVQDKGQAWYIHPQTLVKYSLGTPAQAFEVMRKLGRGISNADLAQIPVGTLASSSATSTTNGTGIKAFTSVDDFKRYIKESGSHEPQTTLGTNEVGDAVALSAPTSGAARALAPERYSGTNVQVAGIDEPDMLKTDGNHLFLSQLYRYYIRPLSIRYDPNQKYPEFATQAIDAFPLESLKVAAGIPESGQLLLEGATLLVMGYEKITAYNVLDVSKPTKKWEMKYSDGNSYIDARLKNGTLYVVTQKYINFVSPCPIALAESGATKIAVPCGQIYYPSDRPAIDETLNLMEIDAVSGAYKRSISLTSTISHAVHYMSDTSFYVTHAQEIKEFDVIYAFLNEAQMLPASVMDTLKRLNGYTLSDDAKQLEADNILSEYKKTLSKDEFLAFNTRFNNAFAEYVKLHIRDIERSVVLKVSLLGLTASAEGNFPGVVLNSYGLDEYNGYLRVATTTGRFTSASVNDLYVLDSALKVISSAVDMGKGERIYSTRFIGDKGYIVTFKETDPLYVLDLKNPFAPQITGELKIPGYSAYLHPLTDSLLLGIGKEDQKVKVSLFDVSNSSAPRELSTFILDEYYSEVIDNPHAFLHDPKYSAFFIPGSNAAYVFGYTGGKLSLLKSVAEVNAQRAVFINDYLYIIGSDKIAVLNEKNWERVKELVIE